MLCYLPQGHVTSFYGSSLEKYTSFQAHHEDVRQLQPTVGGVVTITEDELKLSSRSGLPSLLMRNEESLSKMNCALYLDETSLLVGCQTGMITTVDLTQGQVTREVRLVIKYVKQKSHTKWAQLQKLEACFLFEILCCSTNLVGSQAPKLHGTTYPDPVV